MRKYFLQFLTVMAALVLVSCSKSDDDSPFYGVKGEVDGISLKVDQFTDNVSFTNSNGSCAITAYTVDDEGFRISFDEATPTGIYDLANSEVSMTYAKDALASDYYGFDSGTIEITKFEYGDDIHFKATFSGEASSNMGGGTVVTITNGNAEIKF